MAVTRLLRFSLTTANLDRLGAFYRDAFGCVTLHRRDVSGAAFESLMGVSGGAHSLMLGLGAQRIELLQFEQPGAPYPSDAAASDLFFQHFALVVADMAQAFGRLTQVAGWSAISQPGPQHLPAQSGGVSAFKFRDPRRTSARAAGVCAATGATGLAVDAARSAVPGHRSFGYQRSRQRAKHRLL
jgi:catechol 2,3-dioxygenase-like lactoylglutathione lyase family enzyme